MFLVHVPIRPRRPEAEIPDSAAELIALSCAGRDDFEHVSVHPHALPHPVIGFYVRAESLSEARAAALSLWRRASSNLVQLQGWEPLRAESPLFRPDLETGAP
ncbi:MULTISPECIES: hypothetical protein [unclassified Streptomyces]|uniref:hypothetical protein n=1 Tax=unclassified Streptomyces TaxID=2593676 RepID=UPI0008DE3C0A|nr:MULTISPECIES: hypothetical protein [unclassified Streptomyces]OII69313.1 hypothetical protein BJP39_00035 [Streptomyces sp. CC77]